ncbi:Dna2-domain-containing protein [Coprinellus micaceus]|uniref:DNA helicase n=1 Tax=Coprinellus micaceus TaxID=71717 RepID=A0A4Y7RJ53_COPMI|nr:Dna2-domain-containing protein [Coprinellus micaceus]
MPPGDIVNAIGPFEISPSSARPTIRITAQTNLLILHPDILLTATALSNAPQCARKPLLSSLVRASSDITPALVWGNMLHEVMQTCLSEKRWEEAWINERIDQLLALNVSVETARTELRRRAIGLTIFKDRYIADTPKNEAVLSDTRARPEDIWSPKYGLKGKVDATYLAPSSAKPSPFSSNSAAKPPTRTTSGPRPFEIKTGRTLAALEHRAQTMLYTLLASERYGTDVPDGLLYYTQSDTVVRVPRTRNEIRGLVVARNQLASYTIKRIGREGDIRKKRREELEQEERQGDIEEIGMGAEPFLPPPIDSEHACKKCYTLDTCMLYRYATRCPAIDSGCVPSENGHLTPEQGMFFRKWETLLSLEERDLVRFRRELWTIGAVERERMGRCFAGMVIRPSTLREEEGGKEYKFHYTFVRSKSRVAATQTPTPAHSQADKKNLLNGHLNIGDPVTLSVEPHLLAFAQGYITHLTADEVHLGVDHRVDLDQIRARMQKGQTQGVSSSLVGKGEEEEVVFRIDKDELNNIAQLFYVNGDKKRLGLVVDLRKPDFTPSLSPEDLVSGPETRTHVEHLNDSQRGAISKVLSAEDYALVLGMPGTGKTTVIAALIKILVAQGKTVLLTSYTPLCGRDESESGVGGGKKGGLGFGVLRLGNLEKIHPDVRKYTIGARKKAETVEQLEMQWMGPPVVASTCLSARRGGLDVSLFRRLSDAHPDSVIDLREQYRMNEDIMTLSNRLIYGDRLKCGSEEVARRKLILPNESENGEERLRGADDRCWLSYLTSPDTTAVFVDTDTLGDLVQNEVEADLVVQLVQALVGKWGVRKKDQVKLLKSLLGVEALTADKSQGRDKQCVIVSMVRSNDEGRVGELVKDWRRMNVSFTRARSKLVIFGSRKTLKVDPLLAQFFELMEERGWVYELPVNAHLVHKGELAENAVDDEECSAAEEEVFEASFFGKEATVVEKEPVEEEMEMTMVQEEDTMEEMDATLVEQRPAEESELVKEKKATTPAKKRRPDDSSDVEIVDETIVERKPKKKTTSKPTCSLDLVSGDV